jgi:hypothetical protein
MSTYNFGKGNKFGKNNKFEDMGINTKKTNKETPKKLVPPTLNFDGNKIALIYKAAHLLPFGEARELIEDIERYGHQMVEFNKQQNGTKGE